MRKSARRGGILPIVALFMVAAALLAGLVFDMSRAYAQKNEMHTAADAAALAGLLELIQDTTAVTAAATNYSGMNAVLHQFISPANTDVFCGVWDDEAKTFEPDEDGNCGSLHNAVSVHVRDTAHFTFPLLLGFSNREVNRMATAWLAYVDGTSCVKPWGMNWTLLTRVLDPGWPQVKACQESGGENCDQYLVKDPNRPQLDDEDLETLRTRPPADLRFSLTEAEPPNQPGNFGALRLPGSNGTRDYKNNITGCHPAVIEAGSTIQTEPGLMGNATHQAVEDLCAAEGSLGPQTRIPGTQPPVFVRECRNAEGDVGLPVIAVLWEAPPLVGNTSVTVRQLVSFKIETITTSNVLTGYFAPTFANGTIATKPSTIRRPILVE